MELKNKGLPENITEGAKAYFEKVLSEAKAVLDDTHATQEKVNTAWDNLLEGIWGLGILQGDKTLLNQLIAKAESMVDNADKYVSTNWQGLMDALENAKRVSADGNALENEVEKAAEILHNAIMIQRYKADKSILEELIKKAEKVESSLYTKESVQALEKALQAAKLVMADEELSEEDQVQVDNAAKELENALAGLKKITSGNEDNSSESSASENEDSPTTGDATGILVYVAVALLVSSMMGIGLVKRCIHTRENNR